MKKTNLKQNLLDEMASATKYLTKNSLCRIYKIFILFYLFNKNKSR